MTSKIASADPDSAPDSPAWHAIAEDEAVWRLASTPEGIGAGEAGQRLAAAGPNARARGKRQSWLAEFAESFTEPLQLLLVAVAVLSFLFGERADAFAILGVILLSAAVETASEIRAGRAISALDDLSAPSARVLRGGMAASVPAAGVVPGDVLLLEAGDVVAADARLVRVHGLRVDESALTGEAVSAGKSATTLAAGTDP
jgi:Ca2+-transporting ATPase